MVRLFSHCIYMKYTMLAVCGAVTLPDATEITREYIPNHVWSFERCRSPPLMVLHLTERWKYETVWLQNSLLVTDAHN
jgi:hypothetical protein